MSFLLWGKKKETLPRSHSPATCPQFLLLLKHTPYSSVLFSLESPAGSPGYRFRSPFCVRFFSFSFRSCLASLSFSRCSLSCSFFFWNSSRSSSRSSFLAFRTSSTLVFRNSAGGALRTDEALAAFQSPEPDGSFSAQAALFRLPPSPSGSASASRQAGEEVGDEERRKGEESLLVSPNRNFL